MSQGDIVGHSAQSASLLRDIETNNVSHAYLFSGPPHVGKMTVARWFAAELLCRESEDREKCEKHLKNLTHPDLLVLDQLWMEDTCDDWEIIAKTSNAPQQHRAKAKAKTDTISIDDVRALQERLHETGLGTWRCCIIRKIERMAAPAANALLKILEEPPKGLVFILTTEARTQLLPTIISRSRVLRFGRLSKEEMHSLLPKDDDGSFIAHLSEGAPGAAIRLRDDPDALREERLMQTKARTFWESENPRERIQLLDPLLERGKDSDRFLLHLGLTLRERLEKSDANRVQALSALTRDLQTNAHRGLLVQHFAMHTS